MTQLKRYLKKQRQLSRSFSLNNETNSRLEASTSIPQRLYHLERSNQSMKPTPKEFASSLAPLRYNFSLFAMTPCRGLPQLLLQNSWVRASLSR
jgi:hypothetical protein